MWIPPVLANRYEPSGRLAKGTKRLGSAVGQADGTLAS